MRRTKGVGRTGCRNDKTHTTCRRCGKVAYHIQKQQCASCGYGRMRAMRRCTLMHPLLLLLLLCSPSRFAALLLLRPRVSPPLPRSWLIWSVLLSLRRRSGTCCTDHHLPKAMRRRTEGTGRMRTLKDMPRKAKNGFREGKSAGRSFTCVRLYK